MKTLFKKIKEFFSGRKFSIEDFKALCKITGAVLGVFGGLFAFVALCAYASKGRPEILMVPFFSVLGLLLVFGAFCAIFPKEQHSEEKQLIQEPNKPCNGFDDEGFPMKGSPWSVHHDECDDCKQRCPLDERFAQNLKLRVDEAEGRMTLAQEYIEKHFTEEFYSVLNDTVTYNKGEMLRMRVKDIIAILDGTKHTTDILDDDRDDEN